MLPTDELPVSLVEDVVGRLEQLLRVSARETQYAFKFGLFCMEYLTPFFCLSWGRFSKLSVARARHRFERLSHHRLGVLVLLAKLLKSLIQIALYSDARVERYFGNQRRAWRSNRFDYRNELVTLSEGRPRPPTPGPLVNSDQVDPNRFLEWSPPEERSS